MSKGEKILIAVFTALPLLLVFIYAGTFLHFFIYMVSHHMQPVEQGHFFFLQTIAPLFILIGAASFIGMVMMIYYVIHISKNEKFDSTQRVMWILIVLFTHTIGHIIYFILEIWPEKTQGSS